MSGTMSSASGRSGAGWRTIARWGFLASTAVGVVLLGWKAKRLLMSAGLTLTTMSGLAVLALPAFCLWTLAAAAAWRLLIVDAKVRRVPSLGRLWLLRVEAQAVNLVLPLAGLGGEALRATALGRWSRESTTSVASVASDVMAEIVACFAFVLVGTLLGWHAIRCSDGLRWASVLLSVAIVLILSFLSAYAARLGALLGHGRVARWLEAMFADFRSSQTLAWWRCVVWHVVERMLIAAETFIYARALGFHLSLLGAVVATAAMTLLGSLLFFIPAQVGAADGGLALGLAWLGASWSTGFAVAFARRLRQLVVGLLGLSLLAVTLLWQRRASRQLARASRWPGSP